MTEPIRTIEADELKAKLDRGDDLRLVDALNEWQFRQKHIPDSVNFPTLEETLEHLRPDEEIVVYCSSTDCHASQNLYRDLVGRGYRNVSRFAGGLIAWEDAGYPFEGEAVERP